MLYLNEPQLLEGVTVYPDTHQENVFYPIPPMPRFRRDENGKPVFHLIKYIGGSDSTAVRKELPTETEGKNDEIPVNCVPVLDGEIAGGLLLFDVVYSVEEENAQKIREQLDQQVRAKYLREGRDVPDGFQIILRQPMWTDGSVQLLMDDQANGLFESVSKLGKPSLMGSNVSSFAVALKPWQSSLVERSVTPPANFTPLSVAYSLKYLAKVPPVRITIFASALDSYQMYKEYTRQITDKDCYGYNYETIIRGITEKVMSRDVLRITIDSGGLKIDDQTFQQLRDMAIGIAQDWIKKEFVKPPPERATAEQLKSLDLKRLSQVDFRDLHICIDQMATVEVPIYPQGTMENMIKEGDDLQQFITQIDLSTDEFYQFQEASVKVYADFPAAESSAKPSDLLFVEVALRYGDGPVRMMTWDAQGAGDSIANGGRWEVQWHKVPDQDEIQWEATVRFRDPDHSYTLTGASDKTQINIAVPLPGQAILHLSDAGVPWDVIQNIEAEVNYSNLKADPQNITRNLILNKDASEVEFDEVIWTQWEPPFNVKTSYMLKSGIVIPGDEIRVDSNHLIIKSPFQEYLMVPLVAKWTFPKWENDMVTLEYRDEANSYFCTTQLYLNPEEGGWHQVWSLPLVDPAQRTFRYKWLRCSKDGGVTESTVVPGNQQGWLTASGNEVITIGDPNSDEDMLRVHVDPLVFTVGLGEGKKVVRALVHMKYKDTLTGVVDTDDHTFSLEDQKAWLWTEHIRDLAHPNAKKYEWSATYYTAPYSRIDIGPFTDQEAETVVLEPPPA